MPIVLNPLPWQTIGETKWCLLTENDRFITDERTNRNKSSQNAAINGGSVEQNRKRLTIMGFAFS